MFVRLLYALNHIVNSPLQLSYFLDYKLLMAERSLFVGLVGCLVVYLLFVRSSYMVIPWPLYQCDFICDDIENTYEDRQKKKKLLIIFKGISFIKL